MNPVILGLIAGAFTTFASLPQIAYVLRTRSVKDLSLVTLCLFATGVALWVAYGVMISSVPVIIWNVLSLVLYAIQIVLKIALSRRESRAGRQSEQASARSR